MEQIIITNIDTIIEEKVNKYLEEHLEEYIRKYCKNETNEERVNENIQIKNNKIMQGKKQINNFNTKEKENSVTRSEIVRLLGDIIEINRGEDSEMILKKLIDLFRGYKKKNENLEEEKEKLEIELEKIKNFDDQELNKLKNNLEDLTRKNEVLQNDKNQLNQRLKKLKTVEELQEIYDLYMGVSDEYRNKIGNLIRCNDIGSFLSCCYNIGTIDDLWDSLNIEIKKGNYSDVSILKTIFEFFILQQNKKYSESLYKLIAPKVGDYFDPTKHISINGVTSGTIEEVIFPGYGNMESKINPEQSDEERKFKKVRKLAMVKVR